MQDRKSRTPSDKIYIAYDSASLVRFDLNLTLGCHRFYDLASFTVFDSFSHPFLQCQCLYCERIIVLSLGSQKRLQLFIAVVVAFNDTVNIFCYQMHLKSCSLHEQSSFDSLLWSTKYLQKSVHLITSSFVDFFLSKGCLWSFVVVKGEQKAVFYLLSSSKDANIWSLIFCSVESWSKYYIWHFVWSKDDA
jgi:hypothetical protein